jgi:hypothetical protein
MALDLATAKRRRRRRLDVVRVEIAESHTCNRIGIVFDASVGQKPAS